MVDEVIDNDNIIVDGIDNVNFDQNYQTLLTEVQAENTALKKEIEELKVKSVSLNREAEKHKNDADRENKKGKTILEEKKALLDKVKHYQSMFDGIDEEVAKEVLKRARDGEGNDFEEEKSRIMESAVAEFKEVYYNPLLDELQEAKDGKDLLKVKLHDAVVKTEIVNNLIKYGVDPSLAPYAAAEFEGRMKINEKGERVYLNKDGHPTSSFDWKSSALMLKQEKPALFRASKGSAANPSVDALSFNDVGNPWLRGPSFSRTQQAKMMTSDPEKASRLKAEAKKKSKV